MKRTLALIGCSIRVVLFFLAAWGIHPTVRSATFNLPNPPTLSVARTNGNMLVTYRGDTNFQYVLQTSSNGVSWNPVLTNLATTTQPVNYFDAQWSSNRSRFYKATAFKTPFMYQGTFTASTSDKGSFMMFLRTNNTVTLIGANTNRHVGEYGNGFLASTNGVLCTNLNSGSICCTFSSNTVSGSFTNQLNLAGTLTGIQKPNLGPFRNYAGYYTGSVDGDCVGTLEALISADGWIFLYQRDSSSGKIDGGSIQMIGGPGAPFNIDTVSVPSTHYIFSTWGGTPFVPTLSGVYHYGCGGGGSGVFSLTRQESGY